MEFIVELYEYLEPYQRDILSSFGKIDFESKVIPLVCVIPSVPISTIEEEITFMEKLKSINFVNSVRKPEVGKWVSKRLSEERIPPLTPIMYATHKLLQALNESAWMNEKDYSIIKKSL